MSVTRSTVIGLVVVACAATSASALSSKDRIGQAGLGPVKLGMTERQIERAAKRRITVNEAPGLDCATARLAGKTEGLFTGRRLRRIYIDTPAFATTAGIRVGSSEQRVLAAYPGRLVRVPQHYTPAEDNLEWRAGNTKVVFSLHDGKVSGISTGRKPEIDLVEGCA